MPAKPLNDDTPLVCLAGEKFRRVDERQSHAANLPFLCKPYAPPPRRKFPEKKVARAGSLSIAWAERIDFMPAPSETCGSM
jgi:hypothetical protein